MEAMTPDDGRKQGAKPTQHFNARECTTLNRGRKRSSSRALEEVKLRKRQAVAERKKGHCHPENTEKSCLL